MATNSLYIADHIYIELGDGKYGGYKTNLMVSPTTDLQMSLIQCTKCGGLMRDPYLSDSGYKCKTCLTENEDAKPAEANKQMITATPLNCPFIDNGCKWSGPLSDLYEHLESICEMMPVQCGLQCGAMLTRASYQNHMSYECPRKEVQCIHCGTVVTASSLEEHWTVCRNYKVACPNSCGVEDINQGDLLTHLEYSCILSHIECPYLKYGCNAPTFPRKDIVEHNERYVVQHLNLLAMRIDSLEKITGAKNTGGVLCKIDKVSERISEKAVIDSPIFYVGFYKFQGRFYMNADNHLGVFISAVQDEWDDKLIWPFCGKVTFTLVSNKPNEEKSHSLELIAASFSTLFVKPKATIPNDPENDFVLINNLAPHSLITKGRFNDNNSIYIRIFVESCFSNPTNKN